jgi:hypothetical protein
MSEMDIVGREIYCFRIANFLGRRVASEGIFKMMNRPVDALIEKTGVKVRNNTDGILTASPKE